MSRGGNLCELAFNAGHRYKLTSHQTHRQTVHRCVHRQTDSWAGTDADSETGKQFRRQGGRKIHDSSLLACLENLKGNFLMVKNYQHTFNGKAC